MLNACLVIVHIYDIFDKLGIKYTDNGLMTVKGFTINELVKILDIPYDTVHKRLERAGIKPLNKEAIYPESSLEKIRNVPGKGRPRKGKAG